MGITHKNIYALTAIAIVCVGLALALATTQRPGCDEAWFAGPAYNLAFHGFMGTPALEPQTKFKEGRDFAGIDRHTYWIMPLSPLLQAAWYRIAGFSLMGMRALSILWGLVALAAWLAMIRAWSFDTPVMVLAAGLIGLDYSFLRGMADGRMDMMCAALNFCAMACYMILRERHLTLAIFGSSTLAAMSLLTHPNGVLGFAAIAVLAACFDLRRLRWWHAVVVAVPVLVGLASWGLYISEDPQVFLTQFRGNSSGRFWGLRAPWRALISEIQERYLGASTGGARYLKILMTIPSALAVVLALAIPAVRKHSAVRALLGLVALEFTYFWLFEGTKLYLYVVHISPLCMMLLAIVIVDLWRRQPGVPHWLLAAGVLGWAAIQIGGTLYVVRRDNMGRDYAPAVRFVQEHARPGQLVMGSAELGFKLGFSNDLVDDVRLGFVSGKRPDFVVMESRYSEWVNRYAPANEPETYRYIQHLLGGQLPLVYDQSQYQIYGRLESKN